MKTRRCGDMPEGPKVAREYCSTGIAVPTLRYCSTVTMVLQYRHYGIAVPTLRYCCNKQESSALATGEGHLSTKKTLAILSERTANAFILYFFALREDKEAADYF